MTDQTGTPQKFTLPGILLRLEGAAVFVGAIALYIRSEGPLWLFLVLILAPDLSALGYLAGAKIGSITYNSVHTYLLPGTLIALALLGVSGPVLWVALIWFAHIGADRALGFGLKYPTKFKDTHLNHV